ncbi:MAG: SCO family protein [Pirellulaceae bacterium]
MSRTLLGWLALMMIVMGSIGIALGWRAMQTGKSGSSSEPDYRKVPDSASAKWLKGFTLTERSGKRVSSDDLQGKVYVTNFFFSTCPGPCLTQNKKFEEIQLQYADKGVQFLSISCDPEVDDPGRLRGYAQKFDVKGDSWWFLTGDLTYIRRIAAEVYEVMLDKQTHTGHFIVTDKWGTRRGAFVWNEPAQMTDMKSLLDKLLVEKNPPPVEATPKAEIKEPDGDPEEGK